MCPCHITVRHMMWYLKAHYVLLIVQWTIIMYTFVTRSQVEQITTNNLHCATIFSIYLGSKLHRLSIFQSLTRSPHSLALILLPTCLST